MADVLTAEQEQAAKKFIEGVNLLRKHRCLGALSWETALKFLFARKFDVQRAYALYEQHEFTRHREGLVDLDPNREPLKSELYTGKFTILPTRDASGAAIALFRAQLHNPNLTTHQTTLQGVVYQLDVALESVETQRNGLVFIYDMSDSKYSNFDYELSQKILTLLKGGYPAKLKKVLIVTAPLWFKAPFKILRLFVREKLRDRVFTISIPQLPIHIPRDSLPRSLGGPLEIAHSDWLEECAVAHSRTQPMTNPRQDEEPPPPLILATNQQLEKHSPDDLSSATDDVPQGRPEPSSSASSGFSDDDSLHCDPSSAPGSNGGFTIEQFVEHVRMEGRKGLVQEYAEIRLKPPTGKFTIAKLPANQAKNRYTDVLCYDHSRVLLSVENDDPNQDYINANYVDGYKQRNAFISTQGPLPKTTADFWRMVWEQQCLVIVMATKVEERGKTKCHQYWPLELDGVLTFGNFKIQNKEVDRTADFVTTRLQLLNTKTEEQREVCHFQLTSWPDYGTPHSAFAMLDCLRKVRETQARMVAALGDTWAGHPRGPPILVHCSAGIGRTGTFCTIDVCISRLEDSGTVDVRGAVERIRQQRAYCIQMPDQYLFCHLALIEYALANNLIPPVDLSLLEIAENDSE